MSEETEYNNIFVIPQNFTDSGKALAGMFDTRNLIEAVALLILIGYPELTYIHASLPIKITILAVSLIPTVILALVGIDGDSLTQFAGHMISYVINKRKLHFRRVGYKYE